MTRKSYFGIYQGIVTDVKDPEKRGRIKILCPEVLDDTVESAWCDPCVPVAYDRGGDFCIPQIDEAVWVMFIAGDSNKPVYMGGWWQKNLTPLGDTYKTDDVRIISYKDCTITLNDGKININIGDGKGDLQIENGKVSVMGDIEVTGNLTVKGDSNLKKVTATSATTTSLTSDTVNYKTLNKLT